MAGNQYREMPGSQPWNASVIRSLKDGLGVEDIALRMGCDARHVRQLVERLRSRNLMGKLYSDARKKWRI